jgi:hypothetical protein
MGNGYIIETVATRACGGESGKYDVRNFLENRETE